MNRTFLNSPLGKILGLIVFAGLIATWALWPHTLPPPDPNNRFTHFEDGYSMIAPAGYVPSFETAESTLVKGNKGWMRFDPATPGYYPPSIVVTVRSQTPDPDEMKAKEHFVDGTFHGLPALITSFPQHKTWVYAIVFKDRDKWFDICLTTPDYYDVPKSMWWPYLDSFKYEPEKAKKIAVSTTGPAMTFTTTMPASAQ